MPKRSISSRGSRPRSTNPSLRAVPPGGVSAPDANPLRTAAEAIQRSADGQPPTPLDRFRRGPETARSFGERHALQQGNQDVRNIRLVTAESTRVDAPPYPAHNQDADGSRRRQLIRSGR